jgi:hypothetical protein
MNSKKEISKMTVDELFSEKKRLDNTIPSFKNTQYVLITIIFQAIIIFGCVYAMKDEFSYILTGIVLYSIYYFVNKINYGNKIIKEIKSRS